MTLRQWPRILIGTAVVLMLSGSGMMLFGHGGSTNFVHSCVRNSTGAVRIIGANGSCNANETARDWPTDAAFLALQQQVTALQGQVAAEPRDIRVRVSKAESQSIPHMTGGGPDQFTAITFPSERWDTDEMHNDVINSSRLTPNTPGLYYIWGNVAWASHPAGVRLLGIKMSGNINIAQVSQNPVADLGGLGTEQSVSTLYYLSAGDYVELVVRQNSGGPLDVMYGPIYSLEFGMVRIQ